MPGFSKRTGKANETMRQSQAPLRTVTRTGWQPPCSKVAALLGALSGDGGEWKGRHRLSQCGGSLGSLETAPLGEKRLLLVLLPWVCAPSSVIMRIHSIGRTAKASGIFQTEWGQGKSHLSIICPAYGITNFCEAEGCSFRVMQVTEEYK